MNRFQPQKKSEGYLIEEVTKDSIAATILSGIPDANFIELLDTPDGRVKSESLLGGLDHFVSADPLRLVRRIKRELLEMWK